MRPKYYPSELKNEAVRLVTVQRLTSAEVAETLNISYAAVLLWVKRFRDKSARVSEVAQLKADLHEIATERDALMKLATRLLDKAR